MDMWQGRASTYGRIVVHKGEKNNTKFHQNKVKLNIVLSIALWLLHRYVKIDKWQGRASTYVSKQFHGSERMKMQSFIRMKWNRLSYWALPCDFYMDMWQGRASIYGGIVFHKSWKKYKVSHEWNEM